MRPTSIKTRVTKMIEQLAVRRSVCSGEHSPKLLRMVIEEDRKNCSRPSAEAISLLFREFEAQVEARKLQRHPGCAGRKQTMRKHTTEYLKRAT